jgi:hypothetical protein
MTVSARRPGEVRRFFGLPELFWRLSPESEGITWYRMVGSAIEQHCSLHDNRGFHCERSPPIMATSKAAGLDPIERCKNE